MVPVIRPIVTDPTDEDREWFPLIAGTGDWRAALRDAWANYRDESFIRQYLSPKLIREMKLFRLTDRADDSHVTVEHIHDERGYRRVRDALADSYDVAANEPDIQIVDVDLAGDRELVLRQSIRNGIPLAENGRGEVLDYVRRLWGYDVRLEGVDQATGETVYEQKATRPDRPAA